MSSANVFLWVVALCAVAGPFCAQAEESPIPQDWDYATAMKTVVAKGHGVSGVIIHVGDSITYANPYGGWARYGKGHTDTDTAALKWMHTGANDDTDGWHLAAVDLPGGHSYTACGGIRIDETLAGSRPGFPSLAKMLEKYRPQIVVLMLGTNDASAGRRVADYQHDMQSAIALMLDRGIVPILSTIPPHVGARQLAASYNQALRQIARDHHLPLIDFEAEILKRRPNDWDGTLLGKGGVHPTAAQGGADQASKPTAENLRNSGYLLRGWLSVRKIEEVKQKVFDAAPAPAPSSSADPAAEDGEIRFSIVRDTFFSNVGDEGKGNNGDASQMKLKSIQEMSLVDINPTALRGRVIRRATLHLHLSSPEVLRRVTVSTFASEWVEGTGSGYAKQPGSSTFDFQRYPDVPWAYPGSDLTAVMLGQGGTIWHMAEASAPDEGRWQTIPVDPAVVAARVAGISQGFILSDDTGTEWTRDGEQFKLRHMPNRMVNTRESGERTAPYLTIELGDKDEAPPQAPTGLESDAVDLPAGEVRVSWLTPADNGPAGAIGFRVDADGKAIPRYLIPAAGKPGDRVKMILRDLGFAPGSAVTLSIRAVDGAGNISQAASLTLKTSGQSDEPLPGKTPELFTANGPLPKIGSAEVAIIDALDKVDPLSGRMIPAQADDYLLANHLWQAGSKQIRLQAAKNEFVSFQILVRGPVKDLGAALAFDGGGSAKPQAALYRMRYIAGSGGAMPDPLVSMGVGLSVPSVEDHVDGQKCGSVLCEIYVPHDAPTGAHPGTLTLRVGSEELKLNVSLEVWDFTIPDFLSFIPEMNCYGLADNERDYYRLAHLNRTVLNRVPYYQSGAEAAGCAPGWDGKTIDFSQWDKRFGPYFDGSAFADLPRQSVPIDSFYLPLNDNWPSPMEGNYNGSYWADEAFPKNYRDAFVSASRQFAQHCNERKWNQTNFLCFFNGKNNFKERGWSHESSVWLMDEPANFQDYWALRWFGLAFHEGADAVAGVARMLFRADISRPQWQRDALDGILNYNVVAGGAFARYRRLCLDRKRDQGQIMIPYGGANNLQQSNMQPVGWCLDSWTLGGDGVLPWQTIGDEGSWKKADELALFYPGEPAGQKEPVPSIRLKAYLRGEQDVEYLALLADVQKQSQLQMGRRVRQAISLSAVRKGTGFAGEDAGLIDFDTLKPQELWTLRVRVGELLSAAHPPARRKIVELGGAAVRRTG